MSFDRRHTDGSRSTSPTGTPPPDVLTPREREVPPPIAKGLTSREVGTQMDIALKTVETHRTSVIQKLDLHSIAQMTKYAVLEGLTGRNP
jgi:DNA-binding NarL/FixJ family response regulator